jgi:hypothetical protein
MNTNFQTSIILNDKNIFIHELKIKQYKVLQKAILDSDENFNNFIINITNILCELTSIEHNELLQLNYIDYILLLFYIRNISIGHIIEAHTVDDSPIQVQINIDKVISRFKKINLTPLLKPFEKNNLQFEFKVPTMYDIINNKNDDDKQFTQFFYFTKFCNISSKDIFLTTIYEQLPANLFITINKRIQKIVQYINSINLLDYLPPKSNIKLPITFSKQNIISIVKLLFSINLAVFYENIFALSKIANMSPQYIEECTPGEYNLYVSLLQSVLKAQAVNNTVDIKA